MAVAAKEIVRLIKAAMPDAVVSLKDLRGDGDHYALQVTSKAFAGKTRLQQHRMVFAALKPHMQEGPDGIQALSLTTVVAK